MSLADLDHVTIHYVPRTRALRIVWLVEELGLPHTIVKHSGPFPPQLVYELHPLGAVPLVEVYYKHQADPVVLAELGHVFSYLLRHFDPDHKLSGRTPHEREQVDYWIHFDEGLLMMFVLPLFLNKLFGVDADADVVTAAYRVPRATTMVEYIDTELAAQRRRGSDYIVGDSLTAADIILMLPLSMYFMLKLGAPSDFSVVGDYTKRLEARDNAIDLSHATEYQLKL